MRLRNYDARGAAYRAEAAVTLEWLKRAADDPNRSLDGSLKKQRSDIATCATDDRLDGLVNLQWALVNFLADRAERREWEVTKKHR